jgi:hypothetical protein
MEARVTAVPSLVFSFRHVTWPGLVPCPCGDPGNYLMMEVREDGRDQLRCWCGMSCVVEEWESPEERQAFIDAALRQGDEDG